MRVQLMLDPHPIAWHHAKPRRAARRQARSLALSVALIACSATAHADGSISMRGIYYKERATRVEQPMLDAVTSVGEHGQVSGHALVDAITSASAAAGADGTAFTEKRYEGGLQYRHTLGRVTLLGQGRYSTEPDYKSRYLAGGAMLELAEKNTVISATAGYLSDDVSNAGAQGPFAQLITGQMHGYLGFASISQLLGPQTVVGLTVDVTSLRGYQQNPYRQVITNEGLVAERHPDARLRQAYTATARHYWPRFAATLIGVYRYYRDDWGVRAHTPEARIVKEISDTIDAGIRYRVHWQDKANFFQDRYRTGDPTMQPFVSDDIKLSDFSTHLLEAKLGVAGATFGWQGRLGATRFEALLTYILQDNRFGNAVVANAAITVPLQADD